MHQLPRTLEEFRAIGAGRLPGLIGMEIVAMEKDRVTARLPIRSELLAPTGYLHAATVIALADTACGYGCMASVPEGATGFTTIELKSNFLGTRREGAIACMATVEHAGRTTQVWDATVIDEGNGRTIALFRCTELIVYP